MKGSQVRKDADLEGRRRGPGDGEHRPDAEENGEVEELGEGQADLSRESVDIAARPECGEQPQEGHAHARDREPQKGHGPIAAPHDPDIGRENDVACAKEHGEQGKTHDENFLVFRLHALTTPSILYFFEPLLMRVHGARKNGAMPEKHRDGPTECRQAEDETGTRLSLLCRCLEKST